jgi:phosphoribosyl 1,2-cyclic phosphodiesterase
MGIQCTVLASGSTGNAMVVKNGEATLMIDAGLSAKKLEQLLESRSLDANKIDALLVTHEHSDHIRGLGPFARKYKLPIYANAKTWEAMEPHIGALEDHQRNVFETGSILDFGLLKVESYAVSHDAAEPVGFCFYHEDQKLSLATDLGYVSPNVREKIADSDVLILEANHDIEMLRVGRYPWNIKRRILGDSGHLSNAAAGEALCTLVTERTKRVYLAHLSKDHNLLDLARLTVNNLLEENGLYRKNPRLKLMDTYDDRPTHWDDLNEA